MIVFNFDFLPVSVNDLFVNIRGQSRRFLSKKGKEFKQRVKEYCNQQIELHSMNISELDGKVLKVTINAYSKTWLLKDGVTPRVKDVSNLEKAITDSVFETLTTEDHFIWSITLNKITKDIETDRTEYIIETIELG